MTRPLLLFGAGGLAREVLSAVRLLSEDWKPIGAVDDDPRLHDTDLDGVPVLGDARVVDEIPDAAVALCVASPRNPATRMRIVERLALSEERWATIVHPAAAVSCGTTLGPGTVLLAGVVITAPLRLGAFVVAMPHVLITHDDEVADGVTLAGHVSLGGGVRVDESAYLGQGARVREGVSIGSRAVVGMGSVVLHDIPTGQTWAGVPARRLDSDYWRDVH